MKSPLSSRLAGLYTLLLGVTLLVVVLASSIALIYELAGFTDDVLIAKHEEARLMADRYNLEGLAPARAAPLIARDLSGVGLRVAVFDTKGHFLAGDKTLRPHVLDRILQMHAFIAKRGGPKGPPPPAALSPGGPVHSEPLSLTTITGGYVAFSPSPMLVLTNLQPYWRIIGSIAIVAIIISWFIGRIVARQALAPLNEVTDSLQALAHGDYMQRRFVTARGDEIATLTEAYNDAAASVAVSMEERRLTETRMRQFVADAGHELRTPLTVIAGYIDVLRRGAIEEPKVARQILGTMSLEKEHMRVLIDRLMRLARMEGEAPPHAAQIDVTDLLRTQVDAARRLDSQRDIDYSVDGVDKVRADRTELGDALWNIVENALKYAPGAPVHLRAFREDGSTVLAVTDEGPGMSEPERLHAFERFYRGDTRGEITGSGLGLAIAKRAVERAGGTIDLQSAPGRGTTVTIRL